MIFVKNKNVKENNSQRSNEIGKKLFPKFLKVAELVVHFLQVLQLHKLLTYAALLCYYGGKKHGSYYVQTFTG